MEEYLHLFNGITAAIEQLEQLKRYLLQLQLQAEAIYIERTE